MEQVKITEGLKFTAKPDKLVYTIKNIRKTEEEEICDVEWFDVKTDKPDSIVYSCSLVDELFNIQKEWIVVH